MMNEVSNTLWVFPDITGMIRDPEVREGMFSIIGKPLGMLKQKLEKNGNCRMVFGYMPTAEMNPFADPDKRSFWKDLCDREKIPFFDLSDDFVALGFTYFPYSGSAGSGHLTTEGMSFVGMLVAHELIAHKYIPFDSTNP